jgi:hypothetical protein
MATATSCNLWVRFLVDSETVGAGVTAKHGIFEIIRRTRNLSIVGRAQQTLPAAPHDAYKWRRTSRPPSMHSLGT